MKDEFGVYDWHVKKNIIEDEDKNADENADNKNIRRATNERTYVPVGNFLFDNVGETIMIVLEDVDFNKYQGDKDLFYQSVHGSSSGEQVLIW